MKLRVVVVALVALAGCPKKPDPIADGGAPTATAAAPPPASASAVPDVVSSASTMWDGGPAVVTSGEVDGDALRVRTRARIGGDRSPVTLLEGRSARELGERICEKSVPSRPKDTPILIKPNIGGFEYFKDPAKNGGDDGIHGRTTDPEFVRGIIRCLKARGHTTITIAEGFAYSHKEWDRLLAASGYGAMAREENVAIVGMDDDGVFDVEGDQPGKPLAVRGMEKTHAPTLLMPKILAQHLEHGLFISAPKLKAHRFGVVSVGIKGMQGTVMLSDASPAFHQKWRMHKELSKALELIPKDKEKGNEAYLDSLHVFAERMTDCLEVAAPHVVLAEGAPAMGGDGFGKRWPSAENVAIGGTNPILVDRVAAQFLGLWDNADLAKELGGHKTSPLIETAAKRFGVDLANVTIVGDGASLLASPRPVHFVSMNGFALHSDDRPPELVPGGKSVAPADAPRPTLHAKRVEEGSIAIDGAAEARWESAPATTFETDWTGTPSGIETKVRVAWSKSALYVLWELSGAKVFADASRPIATERDKLYEEDCVEIFLGPDAKERTRYYELEVGPLGHFLDVAVDRAKKKSDVAWSSKPEIATKIDRAKNEVRIEVAIRAPEIAAALRAGAHLPLALYRMEGKSPRLYLAWSPTRTEKPNFHVPDAFGTLVLD
jgi:uncharacterized protein (DUF362 family)